MPRPSTVLARCAAALVLAAGTAGAQVQFTVYDTFPASAPAYNQPYPGGSVLCQATAAGTNTGFSLNFGDATAVNSVCGPIDGAPASDRINVNRSFGARLTGNLIAPSAGLYSLFLETDDGDVLTINGVNYHTDWSVKGGGPGNVGNINLLAGANPFVIDYFQGPCCGAFVTLQVQGITVQPPGPPSTVPEPSTVALVAAGAAGLAGVGYRRRNA